MKTSQSIRRSTTLALLWEVPLGLASFGSFQVYKRLMRSLVVRHFRKAGSEASKWRPLSAETLKKPIALPLLMASAPRWNTHAIVSTVGPLRADRTIAFDAEAARRSAASWTLVVYTFPGFRTVAHLGSVDRGGDGGSASLEVGPGDYWVGLRYYGWSAEPILPAILVDGRPTVEAEPVSPDVNDFYDGLASRSNAIYAFLHYHAFLALKHRGRLPGRFVEGVVVPVGNPETRFEYGTLRRGQSLRVENSGGPVYLTLYTPASFPASWCRIEGASYTTPPVDGDRIYLVRIPRGHGSGEDGADAVRVVAV